MIESERWPRIRELFERSLEAEDVDVWLQSECGDDVELRRAVLALRASDVAADGLEPPSLPRRGGDELSPGVGPGDRVGAFVIQRELERGGMGVVFEAEQLEPRRPVALKVLPTDREGAALAQRVESEAEILARLQHPGIAAVYAAGVHRLPDGGGLPYLAMELVAGARDLLAFAGEEGLDLTARLRLGRQVCDAVHSAHQKGVIHRDLKPSNILVDGNGRVRVIDFGIAHIAGRREAESRPGSGGSAVLGTPGYVSPERLVPGDDGHDVRSDVYSLGVVLAQLCGDAPPRELGWILDRARARAPADRYPSAADLAADIGRFLAREPVLAGPGTAGYRTRCFVHRHAAGVAAVIALVALLAAGLVGTTLGWREAERQEVAALEAARRSGALRDVLRGLIVEASPHQQGPDVKLLEGLDRIVERIEPAFDGQYDLQVVALTDVAHVQLDIGQWRRARDLLRRAVAIGESRLPRSRELAEATTLLGVAHQYLLEPDEAIAAYRRAGAIAGRLGAAADELRRSIEQNLAAAAGLAGELPRAVRELEESYRSSIALHGGNDQRTLVCGNLLAEQYRKIGRLADALALSERLLGAWRAQGMDTVPAVTRLHNHAHLLQQFDRYAQALSIEREVIERWPEILGAEHPHVAVALQSAGIFALAVGEYAEAERCFARVLEHPAMANATPRQRALRPLLHASAAVACGPEHYANARRIFAAKLDAAARYEDGARVFVWLARAAAARAAPRSDDGAANAAARLAYDELCDDPGAEHWAARLAAHWVAER